MKDMLARVWNVCPNAIVNVWMPLQSLLKLSKLLFFLKNRDRHTVRIRLFYSLLLQLLLIAGKKSSIFVVFWCSGCRPIWKAEGNKMCLDISELHNKFSLSCSVKRSKSCFLLSLLIHPRCLLQLWQGFVFTYLGQVNCAIKWRWNIYEG